MNATRHRLEAGFEVLGLFLFRRRWAGLAVSLVVLAGLFSQMPRLVSDTSAEGFLHPGDPVLTNYSDFREQFGREAMVIVAIRPTEVFDAGFLRKLKEFHTALEQDVPYLEKVTSLINVRDTRGDGERLVVEDLLKDFPDSPEAMAALSKRVLSSRLFPNYLISEDGKITALLLETMAYSPEKESAELGAGFEKNGASGKTGGGKWLIPLTPMENAEVVEAVRGVAARFQSPEFSIHISGTPVIEEFFRLAIPREVGQFLMLAILAIGILLFLLFRRVVGMVLPLLVFVLGLAATLSLMAVAGVAVKLPTTILPAFLLAVGVGSAVHLLAIFFKEFQQGVAKEQAIARTMAHSGLPIFMTGLTTAAGLFSFAISEVAPVADLGLFGGIGVLVALGMTLVLGPLLLAVWPVRPFPIETRGAASGGFDAVLVAIADFATGRPWAIVTVTAVLVGVAALGLPRVDFSHNPIVWIPKSSTIRQDFDVSDQGLKGGGSLEAIVTTGGEDGLFDPALLTKLEALGAFGEAYRKPNGHPTVGKTTSVLNVLKETHQALNQNQEKFYALPGQRKLVAQEMLLFENSGNDDLKKLVDPQFSKARLSMKVFNDDASAHAGFIEAVTGEAARLFGKEAEVTITGSLTLYVHTMHGMMRSMAQSYAIAGVVISLMMVLLIGNLLLGSLSMIPNLLPILITLGLVVGWQGMPMDAFSLLMGSVALGLSVDDTIHFFHHFRRYLAETHDVREAVRRTFLTAGRAMLFTTVVLVTGFWLFMLAQLNNVFNLGLLTGIALILALAADLLLAPAMMVLVARAGALPTLADSPLSAQLPTE